MYIQKVSSKDTLTLRNELLRPGEDISACIFEGDNDPGTAHFGAIDEKNNVVGIASVYRKKEPSMKTENSHQLRAMATDSTCRRKGVGKLLLAAAEEYAKAEGSSLIWANARSAAIGFYIKAGYSLASNEFNIEGVGPHYLVIKQIV
ncbi:GNAT family N-acetyltransferase [Marinimicrobium locisalis]|uniref:GNAT family N-acetyltransferase n=1 Tax=Marinimicrobium locisalis TaxID=546022 RepID=UPI003221FCE6